MAKQLFSNISSAPLAVSLIPGDTTIQVGAGLGVIFPSPTGGDWFIGCLEDSGGNVEYFKCTARSGDLLTVTRGQEGSTAQSFTNTVTRVELRNTKGSMERMLQKSGDQMQGDLDLGGFNLTNGALGAGVTVPGDSVFPVGMIVLWSGALVSIPAGWALCNGSNGTPDLRDRFVVGVGTSFPLGATGGATSSTPTTSAGGAHDHGAATGGTVLTEAQLPAHSHTLLTSTNSGPDIDSLSDAGAGVAGNADSATAVLSTNGSGTALIGSGGSGSAHTHSIASQADHTHTVLVPTVPPYYSLAYIMFIGA